MIRLIIILVFLSVPSFGQEIIMFDSIPITKLYKLRPSYQLMNNEKDNIFIKTKEPKPNSYTGKEAGNDVLSSLAVAMFGNWYSHETSREVLWEIKAELKAEEKMKNWQITTFAEGELIKEKTRVENDDGSYSNVTEKWIRIYWDKKVIGFIYEGLKKVSEYELIIYPKEDTLLSNYAEEVFSDQPLALKSEYRNRFYREMINSPISEYAITGKWFDKNLVIIANGSCRNTWFYLDDKLVFVYYPAINKMISVQKKDRNTPYIMINKQKMDFDMFDYYRLALFSQFMSELVFEYKKF
ncbi:MAG: hypothetical protein ABFS32_07720 [Bacteroidota bacterium]